MLTQQITHVKNRQTKKKKKEKGRTKSVQFLGMYYFLIAIETCAKVGIMIY